LALKRGKMAGKKIAIVLVHALVGWVLCAATIGVGFALTSQAGALVIHLILAPIFFILISLVYFKKINYTTPIQTAIIWTLFVIVVDFFVVAMLINKSFDMFTGPGSIIGSWLPFLFIFLATWLTGTLVRRRSRAG